jgi:hypothetical protein
MWYLIDCLAFEEQFHFESGDSLVGRFYFMARIPKLSDRLASNILFSFRARSGKPGADFLFKPGLISRVEVSRYPLITDPIANFAKFCTFAIDLFEALVFACICANSIRVFCFH